MFKPNYDILTKCNVVLIIIDLELLRKTTFLIIGTNNVTSQLPTWIS